MLKHNDRREARTANSTYPKGGVSCSKDSFAATQENNTYKMKFIIDKKDDSNEHWKNCIKNDVPFIRIISATKYSKVEFDIFCMLDFHKLTKDPLDFFVEMYKNYAEFFMLPKDKISCVGGEKALIFTVFKEHSELFGTQLYDYLNHFVKSNRKPL